jgi:hypothetical protein
MIQHTYIQDHDENYAPAEKPILRVALVGDVAFLAIGKHEETSVEQKFTTTDEQQIAIPAADLVNAIKAAAVSQARRDFVRDNPYERLELTYV